MIAMMAPAALAGRPATPGKAAADGGGGGAFASALDRAVDRTGDNAFDQVVGKAGRPGDARTSDDAGEATLPEWADAPTDTDLDVPGDIPGDVTAGLAGGLPGASEPGDLAAALMDLVAAQAAHPQLGAADAAGDATSESAESADSDQDGSRPGATRPGSPGDASQHGTGQPGTGQAGTGAGGSPGGSSAGSPAGSPSGAPSATTSATSATAQSATTSSTLTQSGPAGDAAPSVATAQAAPATEAAGDTAATPTPGIGAAPTTATAPTAATPATPPAAAPQPPLAPQLAGQLAHLRHLSSGDHVLTLSVTPDTFGPVRVVAHITPEGVSLQLFGASDAAREALRGALTDLRRDLAATGLTADLDVGKEGEAHPGARESLGRDRRRASQTAQSGAQDQTIVPAIDPRAANRPGGVDILV